MPPKNSTNGVFFLMTLKGFAYHFYKALLFLSVKLLLRWVQASAEVAWEAKVDLQTKQKRRNEKKKKMVKFSLYGNAYHLRTQL